MNLDRIIAVRNTKTLYRDGSRCIKVFSSSYTDSDVIGEAFNQASALSAGLNVPKLYEVSENNGRWTMISEFIKGKTLAELIAEFPEKLDEYLAVFIEVQNTINNSTCPPLRSIADVLSSGIEKCDLTALDKYVLRSQLQLLPCGNKFLHGDLEPSNIIIGRNGTPYILDWSQAAQGDISADIAISYVNFMADNEAELAKMYLEMARSVAGTDIDTVMQWLPAVAATMSVNSFGSKREYLLKYADNAINRKGDNK